ncbi:tRNA pseudouridine(13) synthase TruD [Candidatus Woesearchaeota archaeon]|jgi:tRNA pseudouridine13 synthase|nr:tRNA pseudouridine(13) synthase TruD [Candidatus Woesearchaeota archaeon]MBT5396680.1 tRNA pseudouridine(13) synthase TruD [Candidatus Woesearchaeota archaeon]MBT5924375.1 tRNA pseudouridine(13) synthase TruD [Candidatus Woesearchaeota archaeon]MBT6367533.1 tRNA pseudouridine(13) synthase TruD [Candidatus Woesearchaeota archaeon]MBT7763032.1 tRNA pseudouridine(13) synthase TruD [Candidatus Woesearchaeota archaeon]
MYTLKQLPEDFIVREVSNVSIKDSGKYTYVKIKKKNRNTVDVVKELAKQLRIKENTIGFAGSKDRNAVTEQLCSVFNVGKERLKDVTIDNVTIECVGHGNIPISLGDLEGNKFEIVVRNLDNISVEKISFVENYFDEQRFSKNNARIGKNLIKKEFSEAVKLIDNRRVQEHMPKTDSIGALRKLPLRMVRMYINAYQSYLWNEVVAEYLKSKGTIVKEIDYSLGTFIFVKDNGNLAGKKIPIIGFGSKEFESEDIKPLIQNIMNKERITYTDFIIKQIPELTLEGILRDVFVKVQDMSVGKVENDELNSGKKKIKVVFTLPKGSYATMVIRKMFGAT